MDAQVQNILFFRFQGTPFQTHAAINEEMRVVKLHDYICLWPGFNEHVYEAVMVLEHLVEWQIWLGL